MFTLKKTALFFLFLVSILSYGGKAFSQTLIKGVVRNEKQENLEGAVIARFQKSDGKLIGGVTTDKDGKFSIEPDTLHEWLRISYMGYKSQDYRNVSLMPNPIVLEVADNKLGEIIVQGKSIVSHKSDRLIFKIANTTLTEGNNVTGLLQFTPLMEVDKGNVSMKGKSGIILYINGRKSLLSGEAMQNYLKGLPAEKIDRIELITDPGSEYKIENNEGILNLILKKNENQGWKGTVSLNDKQGIYNSYDGNLNLDYQKGKYMMTLSANGTRNKERYNQNIQYDYLKEGLQRNADNVTRLDHKTGEANMNIDYQLNDKQTLGAMAYIFYADRSTDIFSYTYYKQLSAEKNDSTVYAPNNGDATSLQWSGNLNYRWTTDDRGSKFTADVDYLRVDNSNRTLPEYSSVSNNGTIEMPYMRIKQKIDDTYDTWTTALFYNHVFPSVHILKAGMDAYALTGKDDFFYGNRDGHKYVSDPQRSNCFEMKESYIGIYLSLNSRWNDKISTKIGLRHEYMHREGKQTTEKEKNTTNDNTVLPSFSADYAPNSNHSFAYSFTTSIIRPLLTNLNTFRYYLTPTHYRENNPDLGSTYNINTSFRYILKGHYIFNMWYSTHKIMDGFQRPVEGGYTQSSTECFGRHHYLSLTLGWNDSFFNNRLSINASCDGGYMRAYGNFNDNKINVTNLNLRPSVVLNWNVSSAQKFNIGYSGSYSTPYAEPGYKQNIGSYRMSLWARKGFQNGISLNCRMDYLFYNNPRRDYVVADYAVYNQTDYHFSKISVGVSIPFGRKKVDGAEWRTGSSSQGKRRVLE